MGLMTLKSEVLNHCCAYYGYCLCFKKYLLPRKLIAKCPLNNAGWKAFFPFETVPFQVTCMFMFFCRGEYILVEEFLRGSMCVTRHQVAKPCWPVIRVCLAVSWSWEKCETKGTPCQCHAPLQGNKDLLLLSNGFLWQSALGPLD